ncbi:HAD family hydrolase [Amylibacter sp. IMCC11727]|uniref:HAD family hydrolase n=1 Tax=Amylibacter sp. IMCC11727 TaxID=3039851 RepID=UPI00244DC081|nr:HAD family hydrolase [Amylibacter sp. IMCC11727]WGI20978.1 HAD family hydrolase [Amylibacter sp. IMCC11727]
MALKGLVFDKDGTLFHYGGTWAVWCDQVLADLSGGDAVKAQELAAAVGYDPVSKEFLAGSLVVGASAGEINQAWADLLPDWSFADVDAVAVKHLDALPSLPVCDLRSLFQGLKNRGIKLGIVTNDYEQGARQQLDAENIADLFDFVAGFDSGHGAKPDAGPLLAFGQAVDLPMSAVGMVGDSTHDLGAGRAAAVGKTIGVLTGPASAADIEHLADVILPDISTVAEHL